LSSDEKQETADVFDVVLVHSKTADGEGACVLRARPGRLEAGEVRPLRAGHAIAAGAEIVSLSPRAGLTNVHDVKVEYEVPGGPQAATRTAAAGPAQVSTAAYRASWERTFGRGDPAAMN
jgi:hypothetical protein